MNDQHLAAERTAFEKEASEYFVYETENDDTDGLVLDGIGLINGEYASSRLRDAFHFWQAALAQREPVAEEETDLVAKAQRMLSAVDVYHERPDRMNRAALRGVIISELESTEAARVAAETELKSTCEFLRQVADCCQDAEAQLTAERARSEKLVETLLNISKAKTLANSMGQQWCAAAEGMQRQAKEALVVYQSSKEGGE